MIDYGHGVTLSTIDSCDLDVLRAWRNDPGIYKWCRQENLINDVDQLAWFGSLKNNPRVRMYSIIGGDHFVGVCGLTDIEPINRNAEFSLYISPDSQKEGFGVMALKTLLDLGFKWFNLNMIWGETFEGNHALKIFTSLGFKQDGIRRQFYYKNGKYLDCHLVSILKEEWCIG